MAAQVVGPHGATISACGVVVERAISNLEARAVIRHHCAAVPCRSVLAEGGFLQIDRAAAHDIDGTAPTARHILRDNAVEHGQRGGGRPDGPAVPGIAARERQSVQRDRTAHDALEHAVVRGAGAFGIDCRDRRAGSGLDRECLAVRVEVPVAQAHVCPWQDINRGTIGRTVNRLLERIERMDGRTVCSGIVNQRIAGTRIAGCIVIDVQDGGRSQSVRREAMADCRVRRERMTCSPDWFHHRLRG